MNKSVYECSKDKHFADAARRMCLTIAEKFSSSQKIPSKGQSAKVPLWIFILELLAEDKEKMIVSWTYGQQYEFCVKSPAHLALLWGFLRNNPTMTYTKICRAFRHYYGRKIMRKVVRKPFTYMFLRGPATIPFLDHCYPDGSSESTMVENICNVNGNSEACIGKATTVESKEFSFSRSLAESIRLDVGPCHLPASVGSISSNCTSHLSSYDKFDHVQRDFGWDAFNLENQWPVASSATLPYSSYPSFYHQIYKNDNQIQLPITTSEIMQEASCGVIQTSSNLMSTYSKQIDISILRGQLAAYEASTKAKACTLQSFPHQRPPNPSLFWMVNLTEIDKTCES